MRVRLPTLAATAAAAAFAGLVLLSGLDRVAAENHATPAMATWAYARNAPYNAALTAAAAHRWPQTETLLARALMAAPVDEHLIGTLAQARMAAGDHNGADAAFRISAQRGWRDPATHAYWMTQSIAAGDFTAAALHADALLRMQLTDNARDQILDTLLEYDEGRTALARRLQTSPPWSQYFVVKIGDLSRDELLAHADVANRAGANVFTCGDSAGLTNALIDLNAAQQAQDLYRHTCRTTAGLIQDPHFRSFFQHQFTSRFGWSIPANGQIAPTQNDPSGVSFTSNNDVTQQIMAQRIVLAPGSYRLTWDMLDTPDTLAKNVLVDLSCTPAITGAHPGERVAQTTGLRSLQFQLDNACPIPELTFWLATTNGTIKIDNVTLQKITGS